MWIRYSLCVCFGQWVVVSLSERGLCPVTQWAGHEHQRLYQLLFTDKSDQKNIEQRAEESRNVQVSAQWRQICIWILSSYCFIRICVASQVCIMEACADRSYWVLFLMKPRGDIPPQSNTDHFPWHVPTSSLREMISFNRPGRLKADLICSVNNTAPTAPL